MSSLITGPIETGVPENERPPEHIEPQHPEDTEQSVVIHGSSSDDNYRRRAMTTSEGAPTAGGGGGCDENSSSNGNNNSQSPERTGGVEPQTPVILTGQESMDVVDVSGGHENSTTTTSTIGGQTKQVTRMASPTPEKEAKEEQRFVDEFGFELEDSSLVEHEKVYIKNIDGRKVLRREVKWNQMTGDWEKTNSKMYEKMKERCRKGIPSKFRGSAWQLLCGSRDAMKKPENAGVYVALTTKRSDSEIEGLIERDLGRTFPTHQLFRDDDGIGQTHMRRILRAMSNIDPEVGYVQGMGFICGTLLTQMGEEETFWTLHAMMTKERYMMREVFKAGFPMLKIQFYQLKQLMRQQVPKLAAHCEAMNVDVSFFASRWFLTLLVYHFPFRSILHIWDIFFAEGWKIVFRVAIALMRWDEVELLEMPFDQLVPYLTDMPDKRKCPEEIVTRALKVKFKTAELLRWRQEAENGAQ